LTQENDALGDRALLLGVCAEVVPCPHRNQSLVNTHLCAMRKKSMSEFGRTGLAVELFSAFHQPITHMMFETES